MTLQEEIDKEADKIAQSWHNLDQQVIARCAARRALELMEIYKKEIKRLQTIIEQKDG